MPVMEASEFGAAGVEIAAVPDAGRPTNLYVVPTPPAKPTIRIAEASAGEKRTCRSQLAGSHASRCQKRLCSAVSSASSSPIRAAATKLGDGLRLAVRDTLA